MFGTAFALSNRRKALLCKSLHQGWWGGIDVTLYAISTYNYSAFILFLLEIALDKCR